MYPQEKSNRIKIIEFDNVAQNGKRLIDKEREKRYYIWQLDFSLE